MPTPILRTAVTALALGILGATHALAAITLAKVPVGIRKQSADIALEWAGGNGRVHLRASTVPNAGASIAHYDSLHLPSQAASGSYTFRVNPDMTTSVKFGMP